MKKNLFLSILSLACTALLLFCLCFGWYVTNETVSANGIFGSTAGANYNLRLQRASLDRDGNVVEWVDTSSMAFTNVSPNNIFLFRIELSSKSESQVSLDVSFSDVTSKLTEGRLTVSNDKVCYADGMVPLYDLVDNRVMVNNKLLYSYDPLEDKLSLGEYLIHDTFMFYDLGTVEPSQAVIPADKVGIPLATASKYRVEANQNTSYFYFALEFNEEKSLVEIDGALNSNCYLYQSLLINHISLAQAS